MNRTEAISIVTSLDSDSYRSVDSLIAAAEKLVAWANYEDVSESNEEIADRIWKEYRQKNQKIHAIKDFRQETGLSLLEAKNAIDDAVMRNPAPLFV